jgi:hypothetical protein
VVIPIPLGQSGHHHICVTNCFHLQWLIGSVMAVRIKRGTRPIFLLVIRTWVPPWDV